jgi:threonine dehydratase
MLTLEDFLAAQQIIKGKLHRTPMFTSRTFGEWTDTDLHLKAELFQKTGSFKPRGVLTKVKSLTPEERAKGLIGVSAGNHAQAVAYVAQIENLPATLVMPENATKSKVEGTRGYGAEVVLHGGMKDVFPKAEALMEERGLTFIHPFDDFKILAGQGTVGLEILEDVPDVEAVVVPVGGGGLFSGIVSAIKLRKPDVKVFGVEPVGAAALTESLKAGRAVHLDHIETIADGLAAPFAGENTYKIIEKYAEEIVLVTEEEIQIGWRHILQRSKMWTEPAGAAGIAALLANKINVPAGTKTVCVLSGGNFDLDKASAILSNQ